MASTTITKLAHLQIPLEDILKATNNFHHGNIVGHGGLGPAYKGHLLRSGELIKIAALRLDCRQGEGDIEFWTEISVLSDLKHTNIVSIIGFCDEKDEKIIITRYEPKGSLKEHLNNPNLTWTQRLRICVGVARAMSYLRYDDERDYGVIHRNINSSTILLDENWEPKLSGFKVSIKQSDNRMDQVFLFEPIGTIGYMDPEIEKIGGVTHKSDVYSFGVVLFEILSGKRAYIKNEANRYLDLLAKDHYEKKTLQDIIHPDLLTQMSGFSHRVRVSLSSLKTAYSCLKVEQAHRPRMLDIVHELENALEFQLRRENFNMVHLKISLDDIKLSTHNFSDTCVFRYTNYYTWYNAVPDYSFEEKRSSHEVKSKGKIPKSYDNTFIRRLIPKDHKIGEELFFTELELLKRIKHPNIVTLKGFCVEGSEMIIVTESGSNRCLFDYLGNDKDMRILTWERRLKICIDVASALNYLHFEMETKM
ncbi:putative serine/threonine-protein kinase PBL28 [Bidens hawaiensis]|uniref:putative serine/threonine-protein kinase PBL28 n=1 Tax=Bidens hawaiensis TaxID=980011 RepID=UPI00404A09A7